MNLLNETIRVLKEHGKEFSDIHYVCGDQFEVLNFEELARQADYDDGYGGQEIAIDLKIVGDNWWLERHEYDGSEWWEYKEKPQRPKSAVKMGKLTTDYGDTLKEITERERVNEKINLL